MTKRRFLPSALLSLALVFGLCPSFAIAAAQEGADDVNVAAQEETRSTQLEIQSDADTPLVAAAIASGGWNECNWVISDDGTLTVTPESGEGLGAEEGSQTAIPWKGYNGKIKRIVFQSKNGLNVKLQKSARELFSGLYVLESADLSGLDTSQVENMQSMFSGCSKLKNLNLSSFKTLNVTNMRGMFKDCSELASITFGADFVTANVKDMQGMFQDCHMLKNVNVSKFNTSKVVDMSYMFANCSILENLDLGAFDTPIVTTMTAMFYNCSVLSSLDLSNFATENAVSMDSMFSGCSSLRGITFGQKFVTPNVTNMNAMFSGCSALGSIDLSKFTTDKVTNMGVMFSGCSSLTSLDVSKFNTSNVIFMGAMFSGCTSLTSLDLSNFNTAKLTNMNDMLANCTSLATLKLGTGTTRLQMPDTKVNGHARWFSQAKQEWLTAAEIQKDRLGIADTYMKTSPSDKTDPDLINTGGNSSGGQTQVMYRLYNPNSGEHFYTASVAERDSVRAAGWNYEGVGWTAPTKSNTPVYRLYSGTDHHYTTSAYERDSLIKAGWKYEGIGWYSDDAKGVPLYRQFNPNVNPNAPRNNSGSHNYTTSLAEHNHLISVGWRGENIGWYGVK